MNFLPIVGRELRAMARQPATHRMRWIAAGLALGIWLVLAITGNNLTPSQRAGMIFNMISVLSLGFAMLAGVFLTADCLSEERREGTLGLLFLTDLKGHDVVLGKLTSTSLQSFYGLLAVVPMLAVPLLMGGVTPGEFARTATVLIVTLFWSLSAGMFVSAVSRDSRSAILRTFGLVVLLAGLLPLFWWGQWILLRRTFGFLLWFSPGYALRCAGDSFYSARSGSEEFWRTLLVIAGLGMLFLAVASILLPRIWQQSAEETGGAQLRAKMVGAKRGRPSKTWLESKPYYWLALSDGQMGRWAFIALGLLFLVWLGFFAVIWSRSSSSAAFTIAMILAFASHVILKCLVAAEATRRLSEDRQSGALELLLVTPLPPAEIVAGQKMALLHLFRWPKWLLAFMNLLLLWMVIGPNPIHLGSEETFLFAVIFGGGILLLLADCFVMGPVGIWGALTTRRHTRALLKTLRYVLLPSWLAILFLWFIAAGTGISSGAAETLIVLWLMFGLWLDLMVCAYAGSRLSKHFRELAATGQSRTIEFGESVMS
jgi:ABC-type transport system involved in cytochrome c biogenesis permease component